MTAVYYIMKNSSAAESLCSREDLIPSSERDEILMRPDTVAQRDTLLGHILLRVALNDAFGIDAKDTVTERAPKGKPYLRDHENVHFSISHTDSCVACAVGDIPMGLDIQTVTDKDHGRITEHLFTSEEREYVSDDPRRFFEIWTRKESFTKLTGEGITHDLCRIDVLTGENTDGAVFVPLDIPGCVAALCLSREDAVTLTEVKL